MNTTTAKLTARQTKVQEFLADIVTNPGQSKAWHVGNVPSKTRAGQYRMIDTLIGHGLVEDRATSSNAYALHATDAGLAEAAYWAAR